MYIIIIIIQRYFQVILKTLNDQYSAGIDQSECISVMQSQPHKPDLFISCVGTNDKLCHMLSII